MSRVPTSKGTLLRLGFQDSGRALAHLAELDDAAEPLLALLAAGSGAALARRLRATR